MNKNKVYVLDKSERRVESIRRISDNLFILRVVYPKAQKPKIEKMREIVLRRVEPL